MSSNSDPEHDALKHHLSSLTHHEPHLWEFLTREELQCCYAITFCTVSTEYRGCYPIGQYCSDTSDWTDLTRGAIRFLALDCGYLFSGLTVDLDQTIHGERALEPGNMISVMQGRAGKLPISPLAAIKNTLQWVEGRIPGLDLEPMRGVLADIVESLRVVREEVGEEVLREEARERVKAVRTFREDGRTQGWLEN